MKKQPKSPPAKRHSSPAEVQPLRLSGERLEGAKAAVEAWREGREVASLPKMRRAPGSEAMARYRAAMAQRRGQGKYVPRAVELLDREGPLTIAQIATKLGVDAHRLQVRLSQDLSRPDAWVTMEREVGGSVGRPGLWSLTKAGKRFVKERTKTVRP